MSLSAAASTAVRNRPWLRRLASGNIAILLVLIVYCLVMAAVLPGFATLENVSNVLSNVWPLLIIAIGQSVVLIVGGVDLSQASTVALSAVIGTALVTQSASAAVFSKSVLWRVLLTEHGGPLAGAAAGTLIAAIVMVLVGAIVGLVNGMSVVRLRMPPFVVTLVTGTLAGALATFLTQSENITNLPASFTAIGGTPGGWISVSLVLAIVLAIAAHFVLTRTVLGRWAYAVGANFENARISGVPTGVVIVLSYIFAGACAALGSLLYAARLNVGTPAVSNDLLLNVIGAVVIGGTSLFGGWGKVMWTVYGVAFFSVLSNTLDLLNLDFYATLTVKGAVIVLAASVDALRYRYIR